MVEPYNKVHLNFGQKILTIQVALKKSLTTEQKCAHLQLKANGQKNLKQNKINKKFIYLISPNRISGENFYTNLSNVLNSGRVSFFQLRLKKATNLNKLIIGRKIKRICKKYKVKFLINDEPQLAKKLNADGCHLGQKDMDILEARKILKNKIIGITCHNSIKLAKKAVKNGADYLAFGAFYKTKTKKIEHYADTRILNWSKKNVKKPVVAIGGITNKNFTNLIKNGANFVAVSSFIWKNHNNIKTIKLFNKIKNYT